MNIRAIREDLIGSRAFSDRITKEGSRETFLSRSISSWWELPSYAESSPAAFLIIVHVNDGLKGEVRKGFDPRVCATILDAIVSVASHSCKWNEMDRANGFCSAALCARD